MTPAPSFREIVFGLYGAWRLALLDRGGMSYFDDSAEGFWKSFYAAALVAPGYVILILLDPAEDAGAGVLRSLAIHTLVYSLSWTVYPVIVVPILESMGRESAYIRFIVAFNWAKVVQMALYLPVIVIVAAEVLPSGATNLLSGAMYILLLVYQWVVTRTALDITPKAAAGLVALDFAVGVVLSVLAASMLQ